MAAKLKKLATLVSGELTGDGDIQIDSVAPIESAKSDQISFLANPKYEKYLETTKAAALILSPDTAFDRLPTIRHKNPYYAYALILEELHPEKNRPENGIHQTAVVDKSAKVGDKCSVGALSYIGADSVIGDGCLIHPRVFIGDKVKLGKNCLIYPGVNILHDTIIGDNVIIHSGTVIGSDGFGFARHDAGIKKVLQIGWIEIGDEVEIGANCAIDRGALGPTIIGNFVKIDNLVQIAHNVEIGDYSIIVGQAGISGSTKLGRGVILAGQVGLSGHIELGDGVQVGAQSGVKDDIPAGKIYFGYPAREIKKTTRIEACLSKLPELFRRVRQLEKDS